jgi:LacI family transcriptional regulator
VTIQDVARAAGVSRAAVSKVIRNASGVSPAMRTRVNAAIEELDYRPSVAARAMRGASYSLGLEIPRFGNQFLTQIIDGAREALHGTPYQLVIAPAHGEGYAAIEALADRQVDGLIAVSPLVEPAWLERLAERIPVVMIGRHDQARNYDTVVGDDVSGSRDAMAHLLRLGHRQIAHVTESEAVTAPGSRTPHAFRLETYTECMVEAGYGEHIKVVRTGSTEDDAYRSTLELLGASDRPTAIFAGHDQLAIGVLAALADAGLSAPEISVVGYDNTRIAAHPGISLTSVDQFGEEMGRKAIAMLLERMGGRAEPCGCALTPQLRVRRSTAPAVRRHGGAAHADD